jgi:hypothetical protein
MAFDGFLEWGKDMPAEAVRKMKEDSAVYILLDQDGMPDRWIFWGGYDFRERKIPSNYSPLNHEAA